MLKKNLLSLGLVLACFIAGAILFFIQRDYLVVQWSHQKFSCDKQALIKQYGGQQKRCRYCIWHDNKMKDEFVEILWHEHDDVANIKNLVSVWLCALQDNRLIDRSIQLVSVVLSAFNEQVYISFSRSLFFSQWSIEQKWRLIESLLKTIRISEINVQEVCILVGDNYLQDDHLDFSHGWPIDGYDERVL